MAAGTGWIKDMTTAARPNRCCTNRNPRAGGILPGKSRKRWCSQNRPYEPRQLLASQYFDPVRLGSIQPEEFGAAILLFAASVRAAEGSDLL
jgi:hypothetical protein